MDQSSHSTGSKNGPTAGIANAPSPGTRPGAPTTAGTGSSGRDDEVTRLRSRVAELQKERDHLVAVVDILQEISASLHFVDILQSIARKLGDAFGLDRCTI